ncbi:MAG: macro domain-containing protein [Candidatus Hydrogenedentota bacterium]
MAKQIGDVTIECVMGDIIRQDGFDAVVNAANAELRTGGGVAGAIHRAAGPELEKECRPLAPIKPGQAVITSGQKMINPYIIHCLGPVYGMDEPSDKLLEDCYRNALRLADEKGLTSVAFPALSTGAFGYPIEPAAEVAMQTVVEEAPNLKSVRRIRFVLISEHAVEIHERALEKAAG